MDGAVRGSLKELFALTARCVRAVLYVPLRGGGEACQDGQSNPLPPQAMKPAGPLSQNSLSSGILHSEVALGAFASWFLIHGTVGMRDDVEMAGWLRFSDRKI